METPIDPEHLIPMDLFSGSEPLKIDLVYAQADHPENIFKIAAYDPTMRLILHKDLAGIVLLTARLLHDRHQWTLVLKDGLRPVDAQARLLQTDIVRQNPHWLKEPNRLLSPPGQGGHPRAMAIDVAVEGIDMGTGFDDMVPESARDYDGFPSHILENRRFLEEAFLEAAARLSLPILPIRPEWWDFRFPPELYNQFAPLSESEIPLWNDRSEQLAKALLLSL